MLRAIAILLLAAGPALAEPARRCDAAALESRGNEQWAMGNAVAAFTSFEAAARCKPSDRIHERAAVAACSIFQRTHSEQWANQAKRYISKLPAARRDLVQRACPQGCGGPGIPQDP